MKARDPNTPPVPVGRTVGLDLHPEVFSAAVLSGRDADATRLSLIMTAFAFAVLVGAGYLTRGRPGVF